MFGNTDLSNDYNNRNIRRDIRERLQTFDSNDCITSLSSDSDH